jgi:predicted tellurium resistance membrane protein TerC
MGMGMLIFTVFAIVTGITHYNLLEFGGYVGVIYCAWAIGQFFNKSKAGSYLKALASYMLGMITFYLLAMAIGEITDLVIKH